MPRILLGVAIFMHGGSAPLMLADSGAANSVCAPGMVAREFNLRGDPKFHPDQLPPEARLWYDRMWAVITKNNHRDYNPKTEANSDNLYNYGRPLNHYILALLTAFRATGDLKYLDEVDVLAQMMRSHLWDGWCNDLGGKDGFLNWRYRHPDDYHRCKDIHVMEEMLTHANVAYFAYAFHRNRDLTSPAGVNYGERADFWKSYLTNHFEPKWRKRNGVPWPRMDFLTKLLFHPHLHFIRYHHYMHLLTGREEYRRYAQQLTDKLMDTPRVNNVEAGGFSKVPTPMGEAVVWPHAAHEWSNSAAVGQHWTYIRATIGAAADMSLERFPRWDNDLMRGIGVALAHYVLDTDDISSSPDQRSFARSIIGDANLSHGVWSMTSPTIYGRGTISWYAISLQHLPILFMENGPARDRIVRITKDVYRIHERDPESPRSVFIPAVMLADAVQRACGSSATPLPSAPDNLTARAISSSRIDLSWADRSQNETGFKIERKTGTTGTYEQVAAVGPNVKTYQNTGLSASTTYVYRVQAYNNAGDSVFTNEASVTTMESTSSAGDVAGGFTQFKTVFVPQEEKELAISYLPSSGGGCEGQIAIYNQHGQPVKILMGGAGSSSECEVKWSGTNEGGRPVASGVYTVILTQDGQTFKKKVAVVK